MKVNLNKSVVGLDGQEIQQTNLGQILANNLASGSNPNHQKITYWAVKLYDGEQLDLDPSDGLIFEELVNNSNLTNLVKTRVIESIER
mgnify:CR=1 FL=1